MSNIFIDFLNFKKTSICLDDAYLKLDEARMYGVECMNRDQIERLVKLLDELEILRGEVMAECVSRYPKINKIVKEAEE